MPALADYLARVPAQHADKPRFIATLTALLQPLVDLQAAMAGFPAAFDLDSAIGAQLDAVGVRVGRSRCLLIPLPNVWFSFDTAGLGFDAANWKSPYDPSVGLTALDDHHYRILLRAKIAANNWDGTAASAAAVLAPILESEGGTLVLEDRQDMTMTLAISAVIPTAVTRAMLAGGYLPFKPEGVRANYLVPSVTGPLFAFDVQNSQLAGLGTGGWAVPA